MKIGIVVFAVVGRSIQNTAHLNNNDSTDILDELMDLDNKYRLRRKNEYDDLNATSFTWKRL